MLPYNFGPPGQGNQDIQGNIAEKGSGNAPTAAHLADTNTNHLGAQPSQWIRTWLRKVAHNQIQTHCTQVLWVLITKVQTDEDTPDIKRLDSDAYKPWGSRSSNLSPDPQAPRHVSEEDGNRSVRKGGSSKPNCGREVDEGEDAVECERCMHWFHCKCQGITKAAHNALRKWHGTLLWLCNKCKEEMKKSKQSSCKCTKDWIHGLRAGADCSSQRQHAEWVDTKPRENVCWPMQANRQASRHPQMRSCNRRNMLMQSRELAHK